jgi:hypothetical protein
MINAKLVQFFFFATQVPLFVSARFGKNRGGGHGGMGHGGMQGMGEGEMMEMIHNLLDHREDITRNYNHTDTGIESYTSSDDSKVAALIQTHVYQMTTLMDSENGGIRLWDDVFEMVFALRDFHEMTVTNTTDGVRVVQQVADKVMADDDEAKCTKALIQKHADVVSNFVDRGREEMHVNHPAPKECAVL